MNPVALQVIRPYETEEDFLEAEAWTIDARGILLLDEEGLAPDTVVLFDVLLESGARLMRAEARVLGVVPPTAERPGGLQVRFRRYGSQTKAFVERAVAFRQEQLARPKVIRRVSVAPRLASSAPKAPSATPPPAAANEVASPTPSARPAAPRAAKSSAPQPQPAPALQHAEAPEPSGIHRRPAAPVAAPPNREALLTRLRDRARDLRTGTER